MTKFSLVFFGSFGSFSVHILDALLHTTSYELQAVITSPPAPKGRHLTLTKNETQIYAEQHNIPLLSLDQLPSIRPDFLVVAGFGRLIPQNWLEVPKIMAVNMHPSLLPDYAGRCPAEWAILNGESQTGVTLIKMTAKFDAGPILAQEKISISPDETRLTLYTKLYDLGAKMLIDTLPKIAKGEITPEIYLSSNPSPNLGEGNKRGEVFYARQIVRQDGFIEFEKFKNCLDIRNSCLEIERKHKAFAGWPGVWTINPQGKRIKLISISPQFIIQIEGKSPTLWQA